MNTKRSDNKTLMRCDIFEFGLSPYEFSTYFVIQRYEQNYGRIPTVNEVAQGLRCSRAKVIQSMLVLEEKGLFYRDRTGYVYLIKSEYGKYKIGKSKNVQLRMANIQSVATGKLQLICAIATNHMRNLEIELHNRFADKRLHGEWFELTLEDVEYIKGLQQ